MRLHCVLLLSLLFLSLFAVDVGRAEGLVGGWTPIKDLKDPHVKEIADFAVKEYNKESGAKLKLQKVIKGESQVVAGINYRLVIAAKDGSATKNYQAVVWEKSWENYRNLTSFKPV